MDRPGSISDDGRGCLPAVAPADRCPANSGCRPARSPRSRRSRSGRVLRAVRGRAISECNRGRCGSAGSRSWRGPVPGRRPGPRGWAARRWRAPRHTSPVPSGVGSVSRPGVSCRRVRRNCRGGRSGRVLEARPRSRRGPFRLVLRAVHRPGGCRRGREEEGPCGRACRWASRVAGRAARRRPVSYARAVCRRADA